MLRAYKSLWTKAFDFKSTTRVGTLLWVVFLEIWINMGLIYLDLQIMSPCALVYNLVAFIPHLSLIVRRLNGADKTWKTLLWIFLPVFGWIIILFALFSKSQDERNREFDKYHW